MHAVDDADFMQGGQHRQHPLHMRVRHGIVVQVEADVGCLAGLDRDTFEQRRRVVGQWQQARCFLGKHVAHRAAGLARTPPIGSKAMAPAIGPRLRRGRLLS